MREPNRLESMVQVAVLPIACGIVEGIVRKYIGWQNSSLLISPLVEGTIVGGLGGLMGMSSPINSATSRAGENLLYGSAIGAVLTEIGYKYFL